MLSVSIKPVSRECNMKCEYCFYEDDKLKNKNIEQKMPLETLENIVKKAFQYEKERITFSFQGIEPMLMGLDFYREFISLKNKYNKNTLVNVTIQTNGYDLNDEWAEFFREEKFLVGLSLDGPKAIHNKNRRTVDDRGTFDVILKAKKILDKKKVQYNILTVVSSANYSKAKEIYSFYKRNGIVFVQFMPCIDKGIEQNGQSEFSLKPGMYEMFLREFFDLWFKDYSKGNAISVRLFENICAMMLGMIPENCEFRGQCSIQNVIEADGSIYACDFYSSEENNLGNINEIQFKDIPKNKKGQDFIKAVEPLDKCKSCKYGALCKGGCRRYQSVDTREYYYCSTFENFYDYTIDRFVKVCKDIVKRDKVLMKTK